MALLALAGVFAALLIRRYPRTRPALAGVTLLLAIGAAGAASGILISGCGGGGGGGTPADTPAPTPTPTPAPTPERYDMTLVAGGDGNFINGESYTLDLQIDASAGSLTYKFVFSDGTSTAAGDPAADQTLTVQ